MSRKDFQLIASVIVASDLDAITKRVMAEEFAGRLGMGNWRFDRELFIQAATGVVAVNARKPRGA